MSNEENTPKDNEITVTGLLEILPNKTGQLLEPARNGKTTPNDPFVPRELIKRFKLAAGNTIVASPTTQNFQIPKSASLKRWMA